MCGVFVCLCVCVSVYVSVSVCVCVSVSLPPGLRPSIIPCNPSHPPALPFRLESPMQTHRHTDTDQRQRHRHTDTHTHTLKNHSRYGVLRPPTRAVNLRTRKTWARTRNTIRTWPNPVTRNTQVQEHDSDRNRNAFRKIFRYILNRKHW